MDIPVCSARLPSLWRCPQLINGIFFTKGQPWQHQCSRASHLLWRDLHQHAISATPSSSMFDKCPLVTTVCASLMHVFQRSHTSATCMRHVCLPCAASRCMFPSTMLSK